MDSGEYGGAEYGGAEYGGAEYGGGEYGGAEYGGGDTMPPISGPLTELASLLDEVHAEILANIESELPLDPGPICVSDQIGLVRVPLAARNAGAAPPIRLCAPPVDPAAALDAQITTATALVELRTTQLANSAQLTAPEIAQAKLRLEIAKADLGRLKVQKDLLGNPNALQRAKAAETLANLNLALAKAATEAATEARRAAQLALAAGVGFQADVLAAMLRESDALLAETNALVKAEAARQARIAEEAKR